MNRAVVVRLLKARQRQQAKAWAATAEVIAAQLRVLRATSW